MEKRGGRRPLAKFRHPARRPLLGIACHSAHISSTSLSCGNGIKWLFLQSGYRFLQIAHGRSPQRSDLRYGSGVLSACLVQTSPSHSRIYSVADGQRAAILGERHSGDPLKRQSQTPGFAEAASPGDAVQLELVGAGEQFLGPLDARPRDVLVRRAVQAIDGTGNTENGSIRPSASPGPRRRTARPGVRG